MPKKRIAIFASGTGTNALKIIEYFLDHPSIEVSLIISNRTKAPVLQIAQTFRIPTLILDKEQFYDTQELLNQFLKLSIDFIVLAGFLWLIPQYLTDAYLSRMVNIHPALLPQFGGKGMYGIHVHKAVKNARVAQTGITIHYVNENYDEGDVVFQAQCDISQDDTIETIADKVRALEHKHYAPIIEKLILG